MEEGVPTQDTKPAQASPPVVCTDSTVSENFTLGFDWPCAPTSTFTQKEKGHNCEGVVGTTAITSQ